MDIKFSSDAKEEILSFSSKKQRPTAVGGVCVCVVGRLLTKKHNIAFYCNPVMYEEGETYRGQTRERQG